VERHWNDDRLEDEGDRGGDIKMRRFLDIGLTERASTTAWSAKTLSSE
jgi:hypothetical protein